MKLTIQSTDQLVELDGVPCRVWSGVSDAGTECIVFVHRVAVPRNENATPFETELIEQLPPEDFGEGILDA